MAEIEATLVASFSLRDRRESHRMVSMMALGAFRIAVDSWAEGSGTGPFVHCVEQGFKSLRTTLKGMDR